MCGDHLVCDLAQAIELKLGKVKAKVVVGMPGGHEASGKTIILEVCEWDTMNDMMAKLQEQEGINTVGKSLMIKLDGERTLLDIAWGSNTGSRKNFNTFYLVPSGYRIWVALMYGFRLRLDVEASDTINNLKEKIQEASNPDNSGRGSVCPGIPDEDKGITPEVQRLTFMSDHSRKELEDEHTLSDYNIREGSVVHCKWNGIRSAVQVEWDWKNSRHQNCVDISDIRAKRAKLAKEADPRQTKIHVNFSNEDPQATKEAAEAQAAKKAVEAQAAKEAAEDEAAKKCQTTMSQYFSRTSGSSS